MKKENKKFNSIILIVISLLISSLIFNNRVDAVVMWMQCTENSTDIVTTYGTSGVAWFCAVDKKVGIDSGLIGYNSYALINTENGSTARHLVYNPNDFYGNYGPTFILYDEFGANKNGYPIGNVCWYEEEKLSSKSCLIATDTSFSGYVKTISFCDDDTQIEITELLNGYCPTAIMRTRGYETSGAVKGDFLVLAGKEKAKETEELNDNQWVIYGFGDGSNSAIMVEGYNSSGKYGFATTWKNWKTFKGNLNLTMSNDSNDLMTASSYNHAYMSWTSMSQAKRVKNYGKDYFKLLDESRPWLIGAVKSGQKFTVDETKIFRSDDKNGKISEWVSLWYKKYDTVLNEQFDAMNTLEKDYKKTYDVANEISDAVDKGVSYNFDDEYSASQMVIDAKNAIEEIKKIISEDPEYLSKGEDCQELPEKTDDAYESLSTEFLCDNFNVGNLEKLSIQSNAKDLMSMIFSSLSTAVDNFSKSGQSLSSLKSKAEKYTELFDKAVKYISTYEKETLTGETEEVLQSVENEYSQLTEDLGIKNVVSCEDLIDRDLREKIKSYLNIINIAVPIILILFGVIDFTKAIFAGDEDQMKKAQKNFIFRLAIAILFFLTPTIVDFLLGIANKVWNFIEPGSCGIFE